MDNLKPFFFILFFAQAMSSESKVCFNKVCHPSSGEGYCCGYLKDQCCYRTADNKLVTLWWFWFIWVLVFLFMLFCIVYSCYRIKKDRGLSKQALQVVTVQSPVYETKLCSINPTNSTIASFEIKPNPENVKESSDQTLEH